jgi:hypothetical protein
MFKIIGALALISCSMPVQARDFNQRLSDLPKVEEAVYCGLAVADSATTISLLHRGYQEGNPLLGKHPTSGKLAALAVGKCIGHAAATSFLQDRAPRLVKVWEIASITIQGGVVGWNLHLRF